MAQHNGFIELHLIENTGENADKIGLLTANLFIIQIVNNWKFGYQNLSTINVIMAFIKLSINWHKIL